MHQILWRSRETFLGDRDAQARFERVRGGSLRSRGTRYGTVANVCGVRPQLTGRETCLLAAFWALILVEASTAGSLTARLPAPRFDSANQTATAARVVPDHAVRVARSESDTVVHSEKRLRAFLKTPRLNDPYDDSASDDPNDDDDTTDDLSGYYETNGPIVVWLPEMVRCPIVPKAESSAAWFQIPSSPFLLVQRLRC
jgi:hypothetical protein